MMRTFSRWTVGCLFILAGWNHFRVPAVYASIVPPLLPMRAGLVFWSGVAEILGGAGVLHPVTRRAAGWGLMALLVAVFPANVYAALAGMKINGSEVPRWVLWARLPLQPALLLWVWWSVMRPVRHP